MSYLFNANTNANVVNSIIITANVQNNNSVVSTSNPFPVTVTGGNTNPQLIDFPKSSTSAFGEMSVVQNSPDIQIDASYGLVTDTVNITTLNGGSAEANAQTSLFTANSGTTSGGIATVRSKRYLRYRPGQGAICRFTAMYTLSDSINKYGVDGVSQRAGLQFSGSGYTFGFSGSAANNTARTFGIAHRYGGSSEIRTLTIDTAPTGTQTATITLNGTPYTTTIYSGNTANTAATIAAATFSQEWLIDSHSNIVTFTSLNAGPRTGTFSFSSSGTGTLATGTFTTTHTGVGVTDVWTYQQDWNGTPIPTLDPSKLNVFQIDYRWLGAGIVRFFIEHPDTGEMVMVHTQHWTNRNTIPHVNIPSFRIAWTSTVLAGQTPTQPGIVYGASALGAIQGQLVPTSYSKSWYGQSSTNLSSGTLYHLLSLRNPYTRNGKTNTQELQFQDLTVSSQGNDPSLVHVFINGNVSSSLIYNTIPNTFTTASSQVGPTMSTSTDLPVCSFTVGVNGTSQFDLVPYRLTLAPGDVLSIAIQSSSGLTRTAVATTWILD